MTLAEETLAFDVFRAEVEQLFGRMVISPTVLRNAKFDVIRSEAQNIAVQMRIWLLAKSHNEDWTESEDEIVAPGVVNNVHAALNRMWPFTRRPLRVKTVTLTENRHHKTTYICPHMDVPNLRSGDLHIKFLSRADA